MWASIMTTSCARTTREPVLSSGRIRLTSAVMPLPPLRLEVVECSSRETLAMHQELEPTVSPDDRTFRFGSGTLCLESARNRRSDAIVANDVRSKPYIKGDVGQQPATTTFEVEDSVERFAPDPRLTPRRRALSPSMGWTICGGAGTTPTAQDS